MAVSTEKKRGRAAAARSSSESADAYAAPALEKGLDILELLANEPAGLTQSQVAERLGRSSAEIFRMLLCLHRRGYLRRVSPGETFELSAKLFQLSHLHPPTRSLLDAALPVLHDLADRSQQSCHLATIYDDQLLVIASVENPGPRNFSVRVGARFDLTQTASGLVLLAWRPNGERYARDAKLAERIERVRRRGYEQQRSQTLRGVVDLSYPVRDGRGDVIAAMTVPFLAHREPGSVAVQHVREQLARAAEHLSSLLGHVPPESLL